jgi:hypothetical protein
MMIKWVPITEERYDEMLGVLPPASVAEWQGFQVGEATDHRNGRPTFASFKREGDQFFESEESLTFAEFKAEFPKAEYYYGE